MLLKALTCSNASLTGSASDNCTVILSAAAGSGGLNVSLSSNSAAVSVPDSVTVPSGAASASFMVQVANVSSTQSATLTASAKKQSKSYQLRLNPHTGATPALNGLTCDSSSLTGTASDNCTVNLSAAAGSGGLNISLTSSSAAVSVPASVTVPSGSGSASFTAQASSVSSAQTVTLTASDGNVAQNYAIQLNPAAAALIASPTSLAFGSVATGSTSNLPVTLTSNGTAALTISSVSITGTGYSFSGTSFPLTLPPGQSATINVQFAPVSNGAATGSIAITSNAASGSAAVIQMSGTGGTATYEVSLSWTAPASSSDPVAGYDIYREANGSSSYQLLNSSPETSTAYTDTSVVSGTAYTYYIVSVDGSGNQSTPSNTYTATIP